MTGTVDLADLQGDVLRAYGNDYACTSYLFLTVTDAAAARAWLQPLVEQVTTAEPWEHGKPDTHINLAFTCQGLAALGVPDPLLVTFSTEFQAGMAARAANLGDVGAHEPQGWEPGLGTGSAHVLVILNAKTQDLLDGLLTRVLPPDRTAVQLVHEDHARMLAAAGSAPPREHFGFADGLAQPSIEGVAEHRSAGGGIPEPNGRWRPLAVGEFILGYDDEASRPYPDQPPPSAPADPLGRHGTYLIWRKLRQDVALFRRTLREAADQFGGDEELLAAKVVGRWRSGAALELSPGDPGGGLTAEGRPDNDFRYRDDHSGERCPLGAHVRRSNPRDALDDKAILTFRHRMIRRGMPYGPALPADALEDDGTERGLVFVCYVASISRQFEGVQTQWMEDGNIFGLGHDKDFLQRGTAGLAGKMTVQGTPPFLLSPQPDFVTLRGGEYLFLPGMAALRALAAGLPEGH